MDNERIAQIAKIKEDLLGKPAVFRAGTTPKVVAAIFLIFPLMLVDMIWRYFAIGTPLDPSFLTIEICFSLVSIATFVCLLQYKLTIADGWITTQYLWITRRTKTDDILKWNFGGKYNGQAYIVELKNGKTINIPGIQDRPRDFERILHAIAKGRGSS